MVNSLKKIIIKGCGQEDLKKMKKLGSGKCKWREGSRKVGKVAKEVARKWRHKEEPVTTKGGQRTNQEGPTWGKSEGPGEGSRGTGEYQGTR